MSEYHFRSRGRFRGWLIGGLFSCLSLFLVCGGFPAAAPAFAESPDLRHLLDRLVRLERDINLLQRQVYITGKQAAARAEVGTPSPAEVSPSPGQVKNLAVRTEMRFGEMEEEMRRMMGNFEELTFKINRLDKRLDVLVSDIEFRLDTLEEKAALAQSQDVSSGLGEPSAGEKGEATRLPPGESPFGDTTQVLGILKTPIEGEGKTGPAGDEPADQAGEEAPAVEAQNLAALLPGETPAEQYNHAVGLLLFQFDHEGAERALHAFLQMHPDDELAGNAQYWLGETFYVREDFTNAAITFAEGYEKYPSGAKAADNLLKLGLSLANLDENEEACRAFDELEKEYPDAPAGIMNRASKEREKIGCP